MFTKLKMDAVRAMANENSEVEAFGSFEDKTDEAIEAEAVEAEKEPEDETGTSHLEADAEEDQEGAGSETVTEGEGYNPIATEAFKRRQAERKAKELEARIAELEGKGGAERPAVPPKPDAWEENFDEKFDAYVKASTEAAIYDKTLEAQQALAERQRQAEEAQKQQEQINSVQGFVQKASKAKIDLGQLDQAGKNLSDYGVSPDVQDYLVAHENGPELVMHLAKDMDTLEKVISLPPAMGAVYIENTVKPKLAGAKRTTKAPSPPKNADRASMPPSKNPLLEEGTWE